MRKRTTILATAGGAVVAGAAAVALPLSGVIGATTAATTSGPGGGSDPEVISIDEGSRLLEEQGVLPDEERAGLDGYEVTDVPDYVDGTQFAGKNSDSPGAQSGQYWLGDQVTTTISEGQQGGKKTVDPTDAQLSVEVSDGDGADTVTEFLKGQNITAKEWFDGETWREEEQDVTKVNENYYHTSDQALRMIDGELVTVKLAPEGVDAADYWADEADGKGDPEVVDQVAKGIKKDGSA